MNPLKLLVSEPCSEYGFITEQSDKTKETKLYIEGVYIKHTDVNGNGRFYLEEEVEQQVDAWKHTHIDTGLSYGELDHPSTPDINRERACHRVIQLGKGSGNAYNGKSLVLESMPCGKILSGLHREGCNTGGMSTRALGQVHESEGSSGNKVTNMRLITVDSVIDPSVGEYTNCILEGKEWIVEENGGVVLANAAALQKLNKSIEKLPKSGIAKQLLLAEAVERFVRTLV